jgi:4-hydroxy 2-oxovalerate aldolase
MQQKISWGYHIPYLITGMLNEHPKSAMAWMDSEERYNFVKFYNQMTESYALE